MDVSARRVAGEVLEVIPLVTRRVAADLRNSARSMKLAYIGLLGTVARNPRSLGELSEFHAVSLPTMSKTITTIEGLGWVVRSRSEAARTGRGGPAAWQRHLKPIEFSLRRSG